MTKIHLYNTKTRKKELFTPINPNKVGMYVCGPTVYDRAHIGNARSAVIFDGLYRFLSFVYDEVVYVRNITDVDDKINKAAKENNEPISELTKRTTHYFHEDMAELGVLNPSYEPRATEHIGDMIDLIKNLIENGNAYANEGHVLFDVSSYKDYGKLAGRSLEEMIAGARVEVAPYKKNPADFVLWKPSNEDEPGWESPWGYGRPGWHLECSAMSHKFLGENFDIHGGGADLCFPHHENEVAQSVCAFPKSSYANYWVHNGFLTVGGEKMAKSLGNFFTVRELLDKGIKGEAIRYALLSTHYRKPLDWTDKLIDDATKAMDDFYRVLQDFLPSPCGRVEECSHSSGRGQQFQAENAAPPPKNLSDKPLNFLTPPQGGSESSLIMQALADDFNTPKAISELHNLLKQLNKNQDEDTAKQLLATGQLLGFFNQTPDEWFDMDSVDNTKIDALVAKRIEAKKNKNWAEADKIRSDLAKDGIILEDKPDGSTIWRKK